MALLVAPAAATWARVVAADDRAARDAGVRAREQRSRLFVARQGGETASRERRGRKPLTERDAVPKKLPELQRACDRVRKSRCKIRQLRLRYDATEIVEAVKAERHARRIRGLEGKAIGQRIVGEANAVFTLEQRPVRTPDRDVFRFGELDSRVLQRFEQPSGA